MVLTARQLGRLSLGSSSHAPCPCAPVGPLGRLPRVQNRPLAQSTSDGFPGPHKRHASKTRHATDRPVAANFLSETQRRSTIPSTSAPSSSPRVRVAVDVDEVLGRFVFTLNQYCKEKYGMEHDVNDYWVYEFAKIWNCNQDRSNQIVHDFFKSAHFTQGIPVIPGAFEALTRLSKQCDLVVVTSRQHVIQDQTLEWIDRHYPGIFQDVYFGNHWSLEGISRKKSDICKAVGASVLIDDNITYATECAAAGINVLLYDWNHSYPWSKLPPTAHSPLITVVKDWEEVEAKLVQLAPEILARAALKVSSSGGHQAAH